mmetsp:Transcript_21680/g.55204  ORF Transcript_21680/g.55204 Transcript_21680/m.55204 type:complete len:247 (-) Transcript_21680:552-1292(-)
MMCTPFHEHSAPCTPIRHVFPSACAPSCLKRASHGICNCHGRTAMGKLHRSLAAPSLWPLALDLLELLERIALTLVEGEGQHEVGHKDGHQGDDHCARGGLAHALGTARGGEAPRARDHRHDGAKHPGLDHGGDDVVRGERTPARVHNHVGGHAVHQLSQQHARADAHAETQHVEDGPRHHGREHPGCDQVIHRVREQHAQRVHLLRHLHSAQLGSKGAAHSPGQDDGCHHWCELSREGKAQHTTH